jgi:DNA transposition AAA+ family ATPase
MPDENDPNDMIERLNESNRIQEARMLPATPLTDEQITKVRDDFRRYTSARGIAPAQVARQVDYAASVISQWLSNRYNGDNDRVTRKLNDWLERDRRRAAATRSQDYVKTWVAETMRTIAYQADKQGVMAAIVAPAGCGKTKVMKVLAEEMSGVYVYVDEGISERELLYKIGVALGYKGETKTRAYHRQFIIKSLLGTRRTIFLDEAQNLTRAISVVRSIYDQAEVPIVMVGTAEILDYIDDRADGRGQFSSRTIRYNVMESLRSAEGPTDPSGANVRRRDLFTVEEIKQYFASKKIRLSTDGLHMLWLLAIQPNHGTLRLAEKLAGIALDLEPGAELVTKAMILDALMMYRGVREATSLQKLTDKYEQLAKAG